MTRAALRAQSHDEMDAISVHEDKDADTPQDESLQEEDTARPVLKDITADNYLTSTDEVTELKQSTRGKKVRDSKKKGKQSNNKEDKDGQHVETAQEVTEQATTENKGGEAQPAQDEEAAALETPAPALATSELTIPVNYLATQTPEKLVAMTSKTPKFDPELHAPAIDHLSDNCSGEDSFVDSIKTRSPIKLSSDPSSDSLIQSTKSRSSARRASRIEDSVEAMDALEDAIEEVRAWLHVGILRPPLLGQTPFDRCLEDDSPVRPQLAADPL